MTSNYVNGRANRNRNGDGIQINGDNNSVIAAQPDVAHTFEVVRSRATGISDKMALSLSIAASLVTIVAAVLAGVQWPTSWRAWVSNSTFTAWLCVAGVAFVIMVPGWVLFGWLRRRVFANTSIFGYVPVGRNGRGDATRFYFEKLVGVCAIDAAPMKAKTIPTRWVDFFDAHGQQMGRKITDRELRMVCRRNPDDPRHHGKIDLTSNGEG